MGHKKIPIVSILMASTNSVAINRWTNGIHNAIIRAIINYPYAQYSLHVGLCTHTYDMLLHELHYVHCTSCKSCGEANVLLLRGIEP